MQRPVPVLPRRFGGAPLLASLLALAACSPAPKSAPAPAPAPVAAAKRPVPPAAKVGVMICRSSVDGRPAKCGTPNAVMVGMKFD